MGRIPLGLNRGLWTSDEDLLLRNYVEANGEGGWRTLPIKAGLLRCGRSCRLRWMNHLRPDVKRGHIQADEEDLILRLHRLLGNRWSLIAGRIPCRTDNKIKNYWNTHLSKKLIRQGIDPRTHTHFSESQDKGSNPGDRESSRKPQRKNNTTNSIAESRADLQAVPLKGGAVAAHENQAGEGSATWPANNQFLQTSLTCNSRRGFVATNFWSQMSVIHSMPCAFQGHTNSTCFPEILLNSATINDMGSKQNYLPPLTPCTCFNSSEHLTGLGHCDLHQYLMKNPVTSTEYATRPFESPTSEKLNGYDLWSMLSENSHYHPYG